jgi:uncharacterized protein YneF (UPF0154 family)
MVILFIVLAIGAVVVGGYLLVRRAGRRT